MLPADKQTRPNLTSPDSAPVRGLIAPLLLYGPFFLGRRPASCSTSSAPMKASKRAREGSVVSFPWRRRGRGADASKPVVPSFVLMNCMSVDLF